MSDLWTPVWLSLQLAGATTLILLVLGDAAGLVAGAHA